MLWSRTMPSLTRRGLLSASAGVIASPQLLSAAAAQTTAASRAPATSPTQGILTKWEKEAGGKNGFSNSYVRDPWFTVGNVVIEGSLRFSHRRKEVLPSRDIFRSEVYPATCRYVAAPQPEIVPLDINNGGPGPFLEGGDVLVHGRHVFVGTSGRASTALGAEWLSKLLAPDGYRVETDERHIPVYPDAQRHDPHPALRAAG
jgi:hypothetical protein